MLVTNCPCLAADLKKVFSVYWDMGKPNAVIPPTWPKDYNTRINDSNPLIMMFNGAYSMNTFISVIQIIKLIALFIRFLTNV